MIQSALFRVLQIRMNVDREESFPRSKFFTADTDMPLLFAKVCCDMLQCSRSRRNIDATSAKIESMLPIIITSSLRTVDANIIPQPPLSCLLQKFLANLTGCGQKLSGRFPAMKV